MNEPLFSLLFVVGAGSAAMALTFSTLGWIAALLLRKAALPLRHNLLLLAILLTLASPLLAGLAYQQGWGGLIWKRPAVPTPTTTGTTIETHWSSVKSSFAPSPTPFPLVLERQEPARSQVIFPAADRWFVPALLLGWAAGALFGLIRLAHDLIQIRRIKAALIESADCPAQPAALDALANGELRRRRPRIVLSSLTAVPLVIGIRKPVIALPAQAWEQWSAQEKEAVLVHEAAHIERNDPVIALLARLTRILFWWCAPLHGAVWSLNRLRERICDDHVYVHQGHGKHLASAMVQLVEQASRATNFFHPQIQGQGLGMWGDGSLCDLEVRVRNLLNSRRRIMTRMSVKSSWVLFSFCLLALSLGIALQIGSQEVGAQEPGSVRPMDAIPPKDLPLRSSAVASPIGAPGKPVAGAEETSALKRMQKLISACRAHANSHKGEWPNDLAEVRIVLTDLEQKNLGALRYIRPAKPNENPQSTAVLVETKEGQPAPFGLTAFVDGHLEFNTPLIEVAISLVEATKPLELPAGANQKPAKSGPSNQPAAAVNADLSQEVLRGALRQALSDRTATLISSPRMTLVEKQTGSVQIGEFHPKDPKNSKIEGKTPDELTFIGFRMEVTPEVQQDQIQLMVHCALSSSQKQTDGTSKKVEEFDLQCAVKAPSGQTVTVFVQPEKDKPCRYLILTPTARKMIPGQGQ